MFRFNYCLESTKGIVQRITNVYAYSYYLYTSTDKSMNNLHRMLAQSKTFRVLPHVLTLHHLVMLQNLSKRISRPLWRNTPPGSSVRRTCQPQARWCQEPFFFPLPLRPLKSPRTRRYHQRRKQPSRSCRDVLIES